jgi:hypothetical protein
MENPSSAEPAPDKDNHLDAETSPVAAQAARAVEPAARTPLGKSGCSAERKVWP